MSDTNDMTEGLEKDIISNLAGILKKSSGRLNILIKDNPALSISLGSNIQLNIHDAAIFDGVGSDKSDVSLFDKLKTAQKLGEILNSNGLSISVLRKGKKAFTIGREATPTISSILTGSDDIHIDSITQAAKLGKDIIKKNTKE
jgi:hypothetical protein